MEAFFAWLERRILFEGFRDSASLATLAAELLKKHERFEKVETPSGALQRIENSVKRQAHPLWTGAESDFLDMFEVTYALQDAINQSLPELPALAVHLLMICVVVSEELLEAGIPSALLNAGGPPRVSLKYWASYVRKQARQPFSEFLLGFIEIFMLSQHFGTATRRYQIGKQRLRIAIEENGLTPMIDANNLWYPRPAPDRLEAILSLMADCGLLAKSEQGFALG